MLLSASTLFLFVSGILAQTPDNFSPETTDELFIQFNSTLIEPPGLQIDINVPHNPPTLSLPHVPTPQTFLLALIDPDAPTPSDPTEAQFLHWLVPSIPSPTAQDKEAHGGNFVLDTTTPTPFVPYFNPSPPNTSPAHRYIMFLYQQPDNFTIPLAFQGFSDANRSLFDIELFASEGGLGDPVAGGWFLVSNQTVF